MSKFKPTWLYIKERNLKISIALTFVPKSEEHKKKLSIAAKERLAKSKP